MPQEVQPQPPSQGSPFNDAGDISQHKASLSHIHHTQNRLKGGERIIRNLGSGFSNPAQQGGFPCIGIAHYPHICYQLEVELQPSFYAWCTFFCSSGSLIGGGSEARIALSPLASPGNQHLLPML